MQINTYLYFHDNCEADLNFCKDALHGNIEDMVRYGKTTTSTIGEIIYTQRYWGIESIHRIAFTSVALAQKVLRPLVSIQ